MRALEGLVLDDGWLWTEPAILRLGIMYNLKTALTCDDSVPGRNITSLMTPSSARINPANSLGADERETSIMNSRVDLAIPLISGITGTSCKTTG